MVRIFFCALLATVLAAWALAASPEQHNINFTQGAPAPRVSLKMIEGAMQAQQQSQLAHDVTTPPLPLLPPERALETNFSGKKHLAIEKKQPVLIKSPVSKAAKPKRIKPIKKVVKKMDKPDPKVKVQPKNKRPPPKIKPTQPKNKQQKAQVQASTTVQRNKTSSAQQVTQLQRLPLFKAPRPTLIYPRLAKRRGYQGQVQLSIELGPDGAILAIKLIKSSGYSVLDKAAINNAKQWQFHPINQQGSATTVRFAVPINFTLNS